MKIAFDTNRYRDLASGDLALAALLEEVETVFLPIVVLAELRAGFSVGESAALKNDQNHAAPIAKCSARLRSISP